MPEQITNDKGETWLVYTLGDRDDSKKGIKRAQELDRKDGRRQSPFSWVLYYRSMHRLPTDETFETLKSKMPAKDNRSLVGRLINRKPKPAVQKVGEEIEYNPKEFVRMIRGAASFDLILPQDWGETGDQKGPFEKLKTRYPGGTKREELYKLAKQWYLCQDGVVEWEDVQKKMREISGKYGIKQETLQRDAQLVVEKLGRA
jgi:hypothetical protein